MGHLDWLLEIFASNSQRTFMVSPGGEASYAWLLQRVRHYACELLALRMGNGSVVAIKGDYSPEVVAAMLAAVHCGAVVVPISPAAAAQEEQFLETSEAQVVLSFPASGGSGFQLALRPASPPHPLLAELSGREHPGLILFSSGSTGKSKCALHDFSFLLDKFRIQRRAMVSLTFLMIDHIGGINTLFYVLSNGGTVVVSPSRDPFTVCSAIEAHKVELLPTSPTFLNLLLLSSAHGQYDLSSLKLITYGTEMMPPITLQRLCEVFPGVTIQQTYGLSEVGILRSRSERSDSLWVRVGGEGYETRIQDGTLWIRAKSSMMGYLNAPSPFDSQGWLNTGDMVEVRGDYIRFLGRASEIINVGGQKVFPAEVENVLMAMPNVRDVSISSEKNAIMGRIVVGRFNLIEPEDTALFKRRVREFCRERLEPFKTPVRIEIAEGDQFSGRFKKMRMRSESPSR